MKTATRDLSGIVHPDLGTLSRGASGVPFDALWYLTCPGRYEALRAFFRKRAARAMRKGKIGTRHGDQELTHGRVGRNARASILEDAVTAAMDMFIHRDYVADGIDNDSPGLAALSVAAYMDRSKWKGMDAIRHGDGDGPEWYPFNRARAASCQTPSAILSALETVPDSTADMLTGAGADDAPGPMVNVIGGPSGRGPTDGRMEWRETITADYIESRPGGAFCRDRVREHVTETMGEWKMKRGRGRKALLPPCRVNAGMPAPLDRYVRQPIPAARPAETAGPRSMVRHMVADKEAYRADLAEYYAGRD
jgi:hypothetical protein